MQYAWTAPIIPMIERSNSTLQVTNTDVLWLENMFMIGGFAGIPFVILTIDRFGRKTSILIGAVQGLVAWILIGFASSIEYIYVARFLSGLAANLDFVAAPTYVAEISDKKIRGFLGSWMYLKSLVGVIIIYSVAPFVSIPVSSAVGCSFLIIELFTFPFMPESPYFYIMKNNPVAARKSLQRLRSTNDVQDEIEEIAITVKMQQTKEIRYTDLVMNENSRKALLIGTVLNLAQHFSGFSVILMNVHSILDDAGASTSLNSNNTAILYSILMLVAAILASGLVDKAGRKILLSASSVTTGFAILILAIYLALKNYGTDVELYNWIPIFSVMAYAICFKFGLGFLPSVISAELYPTNLKAVGMTSGEGIYQIASILSIYIYQVLKENYGIHVPFFLFAVCCFFTTIFTVFFVPETKGKTLNEIQIMMNGNKVPNNVSDVEEKGDNPENFNTL
ncbi:hypothetical protein RI129_006501 [Pyrocoelia pectoralis]|uniref:Major facilitator superfamily (MFS) profile domain-containing protein n=1 Tax=Pyrocoelia pectoralis TaxID=417401 RepID=A0AAN7ZPL6_9COLE